MSDRKLAYSLRNRLVGRLLAITIIALTISLAGLIWTSVIAVDDMVDQGLQLQESAIARHVATQPDGTIAVDLPAELDETYERSSLGYLYVVYGDDGRVIARSAPEAPGILDDDLPGAPQGRLFQVRSGAVGNGPYVAYVRNHPGYRIAVAQARETHDDVLFDSLVDQFTARVGWWLLPMVGLALLTVYLTVAGGLRPLRHLSRLAGQLGPRRTDIRLPERDLPREVLPLVHALNQAIERLAQGFTMQRDFTAAAAHELRTALAVLTARIDSLPDGTIAQPLRQDADRLGRVIEQLLNMARLDAVPLDRPGRVDLHALAVDVLAQLAPLAIRQGRQISLAAPDGPVWVQGSQSGLSVALTNLVGNALAHTPWGTDIEVELTAGAAVKVIDHGPGIPAAERDRIFQRFRRGEGARCPGAGLGLAIAAETARAHGGSLSVSETPGGGASFLFRLQPA